MDKVWTVLDIVNWGTNYFEKNNFSSPRLNIELLLCDLLDIDRISIYTNYDKPLKDNELKTLKDWVKRRKNSEPIEYITGRKKFMDIELRLDSSVLIPRPETELLLMEAEKIISDTEKIEILDIGTGSGCIALQIAKMYPKANVYAIDIDGSTLKTASENARRNKINNVSFKKHDILTQKINYKFDYIISNPPYINDSDYSDLEKGVSEYEPEAALRGGEDGLIFYRKFADIFQAILKESGNFFLELGTGQKEAVSEIFSSKGFEIKFKKDFSEINRVCIGNFFAF